MRRRQGRGGRWRGSNDAFRRSWRGPIPQRRSRLPRAAASFRTLALFIILCALWVGLDPGLIEPIGPLASGKERVDARFTRCGRGRGHACVIDGDTFKLGERRIRIIGIDAPETHSPACPAEARLGEAATLKLIELLNSGPLVMTGRIGDMTDRYGRDLRALDRTSSDGSSISIAAQMRQSGLAHRYVGVKLGWC